MAKLDSSAELSAVLNTLVDGLLMIDANGTITLCNPAAERIFGYKQADIKGKNVSVLMPEPDRSAHNGYIENYQRTAKPKIIGIGREVKGRKADGTIFPMYLSVVESMGAEQTQFVGIVRDLTEENNRKDAFEHLQQEHFHLSRVAAMDQFGSAIAHELNQPLSAIMNYLEAGSVIMQRGEELDRTQIETIMERASGQAGRAADILARRLYDAGCRHAFGMPGGEVLTLVDALEKAGMRFILAKHENAAGFMAEGVHHVDGAPAILVATLGPGVLNGVNVIANAHQDRVPMIVLSGCVDDDEALTYTHQVLDHQENLQ